MLLVYVENKEIKVLGDIMTNHSMSVEDAIDLLNINMDDIAEENEWDGWNPEALHLMEEMEVKYHEWRMTGEREIENTSLNFTWDCGEAAAREDFSNWAELEEEISFEEMLELENSYVG